MESSVAKAHSKRLLREIARFPDEIWKLAGGKDVLEKKSVTAKHRYFKKLAESNIAQFTNKLCLGTKKGTYFCGTYLSQGTYNPHKDRDEDCLYSTNIFLSQKSEQIRQPVNWSVSSHAIVRFFNRAPLTSADDFDLWMRSFAKECEHLNFYSSLIRFYFLLGRTEYPNDASYNKTWLSDLKLYLPAKNGAFLGNVDNDSICLDLRTYIADEDMTREQTSLKEAAIEAASVFGQTPIAHVLDSEHTLLQRHVQESIYILQNYLLLPEGNELLEAVTLGSPELTKHRMREALLLSDTGGTHANHRFMYQALKDHGIGFMERALRRERTKQSRQL